MNREFVTTKVFDRQWADLGLTDEDLISLEKTLLDDPKQAPVIQGTGGVRKIRFALRGKGKSGGIRVLYIDLENVRIIYLLLAYPKSEKADLTEDEKRAVKDLVTTLKHDYLGGAK
jgi:hypothetical protein